MCLKDSNLLKVMQLLLQLLLFEIFRCSSSLNIKVDHVLDRDYFRVPWLWGQSSISFQYREKLKMKVLPLDVWSVQSQLSSQNFFILAKLLLNV